MNAEKTISPRVKPNITPLCYHGSAAARAVMDRLDFAPT